MLVNAATTSYDAAMMADVFDSGRWLLALETSSALGSVALCTLADGAIDERLLSGDRRHTSELLPAVKSLLSSHELTLRDVDVLAYSAGPGSFTGLRIGATIARIAQSAMGCRVVAVSTLEAIARNAVDGLTGSRVIAVMLDSRRDRVYGAAYRAERIQRASAGDHVADAARGLEPIVPPQEMSPDEFLQTVSEKAATAGGEPPIVLGGGASRHAGLCAAHAVEVAPESQWTPAARRVAEIGRRMAQAGEFCETSDIVPHYLRRPECEEVYDERRAAARARRGE